MMGIRKGWVAAGVVALGATCLTGPWFGDAVAQQQQQQPQPQAPRPDERGGRVNAMVLHAKALTAGRPVSIRLYDDSDDSVRLKQIFEAQLKSHGFAVDETSPLTLSFELHNSVTASTTTDPGRLSVQGQNDGYVGGEEYRAVLELYTSETPRRGVAITDGRLRLDVSLTDRADGGRRVWQGWATAQSAGQDPVDLSGRLVPSLVESIGKTVHNQEIQGVE